MDKPVVIHSALIVDHDAAVRQALKFALELEGIIAPVCASADALFDRGDLAAIDCVILDLEMPGMGGFEILERLKRANWKKPVIATTSLLTVQSYERAIKAGAACVLEKPLLDDVLVNCIHALVH